LSTDRRRLAASGLKVIGVFGLLLLLTSLAGLAIRAWSPSFDLEAVQAVAAHRSGTLTRVASAVTPLGSLIWLAPLVVGVMLLLLRRWQRPQDALGLVVVATGAALLAIGSKPIVGRPRPPVEHLAQVSSFSFPSEHAAQAAAIYLALALLPGAGWPALWRRVLMGAALGLAVVVAASRVYLGVHYPTDVAAGLLLGWAWAWLTGRGGVASAAGPA
jgi:membrane-associated phospholipid phosphatase